MKCPSCSTDLVRMTKDGTPMLKNKGLLIRADGSLTVICPHCSGDVAPTAEVMKTLQHTAVLFFSNPLASAQVVTRR